MDQFTRMEKYRAWRKANRCKILSRNRKHLSNSHLNVSLDSSMFVNHGQGLGYPPKTFIDGDPDQEFPLIMPILEDYYRTLLTEKVRCSCQPIFNWSGELSTPSSWLLLTQTLTKTGKTYRTTSYHPIGQTKMISGWVRHMTELGPNLY